MCAIASWTFHVLKIVSRVLWWLMRMQHVQHPLCRRWAFQRRWQPAENLAWHCDGLVSSATEFVLVMMKIRRRHPRRADYPRCPPLAQPEQAATHVMLRMHRQRPYTRQRTSRPHKTGAPTRTPCPNPAPMQRMHRIAAHQPRKSLHRTKTVRQIHDQVWP